MKVKRSGNAGCAERLGEIGLALHVRHRKGLPARSNRHALPRHVQHPLFVAQHGSATPARIIRQHHVGMLRAASAAIASSVPLINRAFTVSPSA